MVMGEDISRLMDGELDDEHVDGVCAQLRHPSGVATWVCYHVIGDALRDAGAPATGFSARFAARLAEEPTVVAPRAKQSRPLTFAWAAAATIAAVSLVGWVAMGTIDTQTGAVASARQAVNVRATIVRPKQIPADYLLVHQEYSPTAPIQGVGPGSGLRTIAAPMPIRP
jgi:sigma-E factor negative regulatory protein RseA